MSGNKQQAAPSPGGHIHCMGQKGFRHRAAFFWIWGPQVTMGTGLANAVNADFATFVDRIPTFIHSNSCITEEWRNKDIYIYIHKNQDVWFDPDSSMTSVINVAPPRTEDRVIITPAGGSIRQGGQIHFHPISRVLICELAKDQKSLFGVASLWRWWSVADWSQKSKTYSNFGQIWTGK